MSEGHGESPVFIRFLVENEPNSEVLGGLVGKVTAISNWPEPA